MKDLKTWWYGIVRDDKFDQIKLLARSEFLDTNPVAEAMAGAMRYERIMAELPLAEDSEQDVLAQVNPGLNHDLDIHHEHDKKRK